MKPRSFVTILVCLALGLVSGIAYVQRIGPSPGPTAGRVEPLAAASQDRTAPVPPCAATAAAIPFSWRQIESEDYHQYIANLRAIGCPEQTVRDIILADVNKLYAARELPLKSAPKPTPDNPAGEAPEQKLERLRELRTVQQEKRWTVKELLGIDSPLDMLPSSGSRDYHAFEVALRFLPEEKRDSVQSLQESYWQQADALTAKYGKKNTPEFAVESRQLKDSLRLELGKLLTPQELEDYDIRTSTTAKQLSTSLATYFHPTEDEFRKIFRAKQENEATLDQLSTLSAPAAPVAGLDPQALAQQRAAQSQAVAEARATATTQLNDQLKSALSDDRFSEYQRSQDRTYDLLTRLGVRYNLPQETVLQAYDLQKSFKPQPGPVGDGMAPSTDQADLQKQLNDRLTAILGEQAARGYRRVNGGAVPIK